MSEEIVKIHRNIPQMFFGLIFAQVSVLLWGRGTGKSEGAIAEFIVRNIHAMPRSVGVVMGETYSNVLSKTLPGTIAGFERLGYYEDIHFFKKKFANANYGWEKPYRAPQDATHFYHWYTGSGFYIGSQDRPGILNGIDSHWHVIDEAKTFNKQMYDEEVYPTLRGKAELWDHLSNYRSQLFCSDMPKTTAGKWLLEYRDKMDTETVDIILNTQFELITLQEKFLTAGEATKEKIRPKLRKLYNDLNLLRKGTVYFSKASSFDNIHALGLDAIVGFKRSLKDIDFRLSVMSEELIKIENGFYGLLDRDVHGYSKPNYSYIDTLDIDYRNPDRKDCRWDGDIDPHQPLDVACDYNNAINCIVTGQEIRGVYWLLSSKYVLHPLLLGDCVELWNEYYKYHPVKEVNYYYDATAVKGDARSDISFADEWSDELSKLGWSVNRIDIGQIGSHNSRYHFWGRLLQGQDDRLPKFYFNKTNCEDWEKSCQQAGIIKLGNKYKKDKSSEKPGSGIDPQEATHLSEAGDVLVWGKYRERFSDDSTYVGITS
jgi:hypothetical protein